MISQDQWFQTHSGIVWHPYAPEASKVSIDDIAHALSLQCRFNGHCQAFYSVAVHSVLVSEICVDRVLGGPSALAGLVGLLHDAAEAYVGDLISPMKRGPVGPAFAAVETATREAIFQAFGLPEDAWGDHAALVASADLTALATERRDLMGPCARSWESLEGVRPLGASIGTMWTPQRARLAFLGQFNALMAVMNSFGGDAAT